MASLGDKLDKLAGQVENVKALYPVYPTYGQIGKVNPIRIEKVGPRELKVDELAEEEKAAAVKCKLGSHTPLIVGGERRCACCGMEVDQPLDEQMEDRVTHQRVVQEMTAERIAAMANLVPQLGEMKRVAPELAKHLPTTTTRAQTTGAYTRAYMPALDAINNTINNAFSVTWDGSVKGNAIMKYGRGR